MFANLKLLVIVNIKKSISMSIVFFLVTTIILFVFQTSYHLDRGFDHLYEQKVNETNSADFMAIIPTNFYQENVNEIHAFMKNDTLIYQQEIGTAIFLTNTNISCNEKEKINGSWIFRNADRQEELSQFVLVEEFEESSENPIYVPYVCKTFFGYELGDTLKFTSENQQYEYIIAGFTEDVLMGSRGTIAFDLPEKQFKALKEVAATQNAVQVLIKTQGNPEVLTKQFMDFIGRMGDIEFMTSSDVVYAKNVRVGNMSIYLAIMKATTIVGWLVCFSVIGFHMKNTFERDLKEIGTLKAIGYSSRTIMCSYIIQFVIIGMISSILGVLLSYAVFPMVVSTIATDIGFEWKTYDANSNILTISLMTIIFISLLTTLCSLRIMRLRPTEAFRNTMSRNTGKGSFVSVAKLPLSLDTSIALNRIFFEPAKSFFVIALMSIVLSIAGFGLILYAELVADEQGLKQITGAEVYTINIQVNNPANVKWLTNELEKESQVRKIMTVLEPGSSKVLCEDQIYASLGVYSDYDALENPSIYRGRYPKHDNEVAISGNLAAKVGKKIGDTIVIVQTFQDVPIEKKFLISGFTQGTYTGGLDVFLTVEGLMQIEPNRRIDTIHLYLTENTDASNFCLRISESFGNEISYIGDFETLFNSQFQSIVNSVASLVILIMIIIFVVVMAVVFFITKITLLRQKQDFGIMKVIGFSTKKIVNQVSVTFLIYIAGGGIISTIFLRFFINDIIKIMFSNMGVHKVDFQFPIVWILVLIAAIGGIGYLMAAIAAMSIRHIVPCDLLNEE